MTTVPDDASRGAHTEASVEAPRRRTWWADAGEEAAALMRHLNARPWLVAGRDDEKIAAARRNDAVLKQVYGRIGWSIHIDRDLVRLRKSAPARPDVYAASAPGALTRSWFFLLVAAADGLEPDVGVGRLVNAARAAAAEAGLLTSNDMSERRAIVAALKMLDERGVIERVDGAIDSYLNSDDAPVLLHIHHTRLLHVIANPGTIDAAEDLQAWLYQARREPDAARRMRRALVDDSCVHVIDLDDEENAWLSQRVRADDGGPLAAAFGLTLERRAEGVAFVVEDDAFRYPSELGPLPFPTTGTSGHAALLLCGHASTHGTALDAPGAGWRGLTQTHVTDALAGFAAQNAAGKGGWSAEFSGDIEHLADVVFGLLSGINALRVILGADEGQPTWWFAPVTGRWAEATSTTEPARHRGATEAPSLRASARHATALGLWEEAL